MSRDIRRTTIISMAILLVACSREKAEDASAGPTAIHEPILKLLEAKETNLPGLVTLAGSNPATMDVRGHIYFVDRDGRRVIEFDSSLKEVKRSGRRGGGPGEYSSPVSIGRFGNGQIVVLDKALRRLQILTWPTDTSQVIVARTLALAGSSESMCLLSNDHIVVLGFEEGHRLRILDSTGTVLRRMAPVPRNQSAMAADMLTDGIVACDENRDRVIVAYKFTPVVEVFRLTSGDLQSTDTLAPFRRLRIEDKGKSFSIAAGKEGYSIPVTIVVGPHSFAVQTTYDERRDNAPDSVTTHIHRMEVRGWNVQYDMPVLTQLAPSTYLSVTGDSLATMTISRLSSSDSLSF